MAQIHFDGQTYTAESGKSLLDTLLSQHCRIPWSCRAGLCHSCLMQATSGGVPTDAGHGLSRDQVENGYFLACQCHPSSDITVRLPERHLQPQPALVTRKDILSSTLLAIRLAPRMPLRYRPGQHILLWRDDTHSSRYCLLSQPEHDGELLIHAERRVGSDFGSWLFDEADCGTRVTLSELAGQCFYRPERNSSPLVILGSGVGIGAAMAITRDALALNHPAPLVTLLHVTNGSPETFYLRDHALPASNLLNITAPDATPFIGELLTDRRFQNARFLFIGDHETVLTAERYLNNQGIPATRIITQPFLLQKAG